MLRIEDRKSTIENTMLLDQLKEFQKQNRDLQMKNQLLNFQVRQANDELQRKFELQMRQLDA